MQIKNTIITICLSGMVAAGTTQASIIFDSISNTGTNTTIAGGGKAVSFTIASGTDYSFDSLDVVISNVSGSSNVEFSIWSNDTGASPVGSKILDLTNGATPASGTNTYTAGSPLTLTEGSTYWIVATGTGWEWDGATTAPSTGTTAGATFGFAGNPVPSNWDATSGVTNAMTINATAVPEPSTSAFLGLGLIGLLARRRRA